MNVQAAGAQARPEPDRPLASVAPVFWALEALVWAVPLVVVAFVAGPALRDQDGLAHTSGVLVPWAAIAVAAVGVLIVPRLRARRWRWRLDDEELDLRRGAITDVRTIIPVSRIQHVDIRRGVVAQLCAVCTLVVHTAAGATAIPALREGEAAEARDRIAGLIRAPDDL